MTKQHNASSKELSQALSQLGRRLIQAGYVNLAQMQQAAGTTRSGQPLMEILQEITGRPVPSDLVQNHIKQHPFIVKTLYGVEFCTLEEISSQEMLRLISEFIPIAFCRRYQLLPINQSNPRSLTVVMVEPNNLKAKQELQSLLSPQKIQPQYFGIRPEDYNQLLEQHTKQSRISQSPEVEIAQVIEETQINLGEMVDDIPDADLREEKLGLREKNLTGEDSVIVILIEKILNEAIEKKATQIRIERHNNSVIVELEEDGIFYPGEEGQLSLDLLPAVISHLKMLANIDGDSDAEFKPLQGRLRLRFNGRSVEFWLTCLGEKISLRILNQSSSLNLEELVLDPTTRQTILNLLENDSGLLIVTGTNRLEIINTLYSLLTQCQKTQVKITTVEEPVERIIPGITQLEVERFRNSHTSILRGILPEDLNVIMIDDVPDAITAKIILDLIIKGRLVLVGLADQDSTQGVIRLLAQNFPAPVLAEKLLGVIHHRYLRCLCPVCRLSHIPTHRQLTQFGMSVNSPENMAFYRANTLSTEDIKQAKSKGRLCRNCNGLGYRGQISVYEVLQATPPLKRIIAQRPNHKFLAQAVEQENTKSSISYAIELVYQGLTTLEEIERIFSDKLTEYAKVVTIGKEKTFVPLVNQRIEKIENFLMGLLHEFQQLKQLIKKEDTGLETSLSELREELSEDVHPDLDPNKQTIASQSAFYEELLDSGEWDQLRNELDLDKETIAADFSPYEAENPRPPRKSPRGSVPDPW